MQLPDVVNTFGCAMQKKYGEKVHKIAINAAFTCPNRDGTKGIGGCTFCNNASFSPNEKNTPALHQQLYEGKSVIQRRTGAKKYLAYFQAYTNTYADINILKTQYDAVLTSDNIVGLSVGTRPDCVPNEVLALLATYQEQGYEIWLELGLQSAFDKTLDRVNRGHYFAEYVDAIKRAHSFNLQVCTHLIIGLPGETAGMNMQSHHKVMELGAEGLKLHPLHIVKHTRLAIDWRRGDHVTLSRDEYVDTVSSMIQHTPEEVIFHRLTATAKNDILLGPDWCNKKWSVLNAICSILKKNGAKQASALH